MACFAKARKLNQREMIFDYMGKYNTAGWEETIIYNIGLFLK